ncbi:MAG: glycosyltransferase [Rhodocyclaceae bacterium]|nr:glycosyltransferase [Rhodocyclaceae bacterium]
MMRVCHQVNFQRQFGGGEVYTAFVARALQELGWRSRLFVHPEARYWRNLDLGDTELIPVASHGDISARLATGPILCHAPGEEARRLVGGDHAVACMAHMPPQGRKAASFAGFDLLLPVSGYVRQGLLEAGIDNVHDEPLYGVADPRHAGETMGLLRRGSLFDWDRKKVRDRLLGASEPLWGRLLPQPVYTQQTGVLTLAIVSRITTIKQFPLLFALLAPILARQPNMRLEVFGSGGYASMRDLRRALAPLGPRVGWWGHQRDVATVYRNVDYVLTGLPEREALGLNVIEAQACGTPVLAVDAPPFTETVIDGAGGFLFRDPREDHGAAFADLLARIVDPATRPDPLAAANAAHLARFSAEAFRARLGRALEVLCR